MEDNKELKAKYEALKLNPKEFVKVDIGDEVLDAWMIKPKDFDPTKKYPLLFYVYGEPALGWRQSLGSVYGPTGLHCNECGQSRNQDT